MIIFIVVYEDLPVDTKKDTIAKKVQAVVEIGITITKNDKLKKTKKDSVKIVGE